MAQQRDQERISARLEQARARALARIVAGEPEGRDPRLVEQLLSPLGIGPHIGAVRRRLAFAEQRGLDPRLVGASIERGRYLLTQEALADEICRIDSEGGSQMMNADANNASNEQLWTVKQVAEYLQMSTSWVYRRTESGEIPHAKFGHITRYSPARIREFAEQLHDPAPRAKVIRMPARRKGG